jgi:crotonobetaine/carnitine-CoA ligase
MLKPLEVLKRYRDHDYTLAGAFESRCAAGPDRPFVVFKGRTWSWAGFGEEHLAIARLLVARGVRRGDRVGVMAGNHIGHLKLLFACARIGAILVPVNPKFGVSEAQYVMHHAGISGVVCGKDELSVVHEACTGITPAPWFMLFDESTADTPQLEAAAATAVDTRLPEQAGADDSCVIIYTSGSTGFPKGAMHSQRNFVTSGEANVARLWLQPEDRLLIVLPLFHVNALFYSLAGTLMAGATALVQERFSASTFWQTAVDTGATQVNLIDAAGRILKLRPRSEFRPEHRIRIAYGVRPESQQCFREEFGIKDLLTGFGMTEIPGLSCNPYEGLRKTDSLGPIGCHPDPARPWAQCRLVDDQGQDVGVGQTGELWVKHPVIMQGYFRDPEQTAATFHDGWFKTGDLMRRDADGYFYFVTRKKDIIRRRGENIAGAEIDSTIAAHPAVEEVAAVPVPAELGDEEILVVVVLKPGSDASAQDIAAWCAARLAAMKVPRYVLFMDALPHTPTHKIAKHVLKADATLRDRAIDLQSVA